MDYSFDGGPVNDDELSTFIMPTLNNSNLLRPLTDMTLFGPKYDQNSTSEKMERDAQRDARRKRRQTQRSRRAIVAPEKIEPQKTERTAVGLYHNATLALNEGFILSGSRPKELDSVIAKIYQDYVEQENQKHELIRRRATPNSAAKIRIWRCLGCQKRPFETPVIRIGPANSRNLCNDCGLSFIRIGKIKSGRMSGDRELVTLPPLFINDVNYLDTLIKSR